MTAASALRIPKLDPPTGLRTEESEGWLAEGESFKQKLILPFESKGSKPKVLEKTDTVISFRPLHSSPPRGRPPEGLPSRLAQDESPERRIEHLGADRDRYAAENQLLHARIMDLQTTAGREIQRYDELLADYRKLQVEQANLQALNKTLIDRLDERGKANDQLQSILISRADNRLRMAESYEGRVEDVHGDRVVVVYDVNGDIVEQTYESRQFIDGRLPDVGARLAVFVNVAEVRPRAVEARAGEKGVHDEPVDAGRRPLSGTVEF